MNKLVALVAGNKLIIVAVLLIAGGLVVSGSAHANSASNNNLYCGFTVFGRQGCHGLLKNQDLYNYDPTDSTTVAGNVVLYNPNDPNADVLPTATVNSVASFEALYEQFLAGGSPTRYDYNSFGAAATIDLMLGAAGSDICSWYTPGATTCTWSAAVAYAQNPAHLADWESRVNYYGAHGLIDWNQATYMPASLPHGGHACVTNGPGCWTPNATSPPMKPAYDDQDMVMVRNDGVDAGIINTIAFQNPDGSDFTLNRVCGNFQGQLEQIAAPPPITLSCAGMRVDTATPDPNHPFTLRVAVQYNPAATAPSAFGPDNMALHVIGPSPYKGYSQSTSSPAISPDGTATATFTVPAPGVSGTFNVTWQVAGPQVPTTSCSASIVVAYQPYFDVVGGDVSAGEGFGGGCADEPGADITGYNTDGVSSGNYFGAGTRQAALATGTISSFATNETNDYTNGLGTSSDGATAHLPSGLAGSNIAPSPPNYGGHFLGSGSSGWCVPDYVGSVTAAADYTTQPNWNQLQPNAAGYVVRLSGSQTLPAIQLNPGVHVTVLVTGSVYLTGNIKYAAYAATMDIPQFNLLVSGGGIFVDPSVSELHGFYDAQSSGGNPGNIYTCATGASVADVLKDYTRCSTARLTIYGAVAANQVVFGRTRGGVSASGGASSDPAEQIIYTPELWLGSLSSGNATPPRYQAYTALPPVL